MSTFSSVGDTMDFVIRSSEVCMGRLLALFMLVASIGRLDGQIVIRRQSTSAPASLERVLEGLARGRTGALLVMDAKGTLKDGLQKLIEQDPLVDLAVPLQSFEIATGPGKELREREGWDERARWAFLDAKGLVRLQGTELPHGPEFAERLLASGFLDRAAELEAYIRKHSDSVEALQQLAQHRFKIAQVRMKRFLKPQDPAAPPKAEAHVASPELQRPLTEAEDRQVWGAAADTLDRLMKRDGWQMVFGNLFGWGPFPMAMPTEARFSPLMRGVCARHLGKVEEALLRAPDNTGYWRGWVRMAGVAEMRSLRDLCAQVVPTPSGEPSLLPPDSVIGEFLAECRLAKDWRALQDAMAPRFEACRNEFKGPQFVPFMGDTGMGNRFVASRWEQMVGPYVEALLMQEHVAQAEAVVVEAISWSASGDLANLAAATARRCGQEEVAKRWAELTPKAK